MDEPQPIRVVIVDDHDMIRSGLAVFLEAFDDLQLVGEATDGREAIRLCDEVKPDVALMDLVMPQMDGVTAIRAIRQAHPETQVIALTSFGDQNLVQEALHAGPSVICSRTLRLTNWPKRFERPGRASRRLRPKRFVPWSKRRARLNHSCQRSRSPTANPRCWL